MNEFKTGIKTGLIIYGAGIIITTVVHLISGWDNPHSPPGSFLVVILTVVVGGVRLFITLKQTLADRSIKAKGELIVHASVAAIILIFSLAVKYY